MGQFQTWFEQRSLYLLPDGTPVVAQYFDFAESPRWWFVELHEDGQMGTIAAAVYPNGRVWNYIFEPDRGLCVPQYSDLTIDDLQLAPAVSPGRNWATRSGAVLALLWAVDSLNDMIGAAAAVAI
jgi:hypothetical protein